MHLTPIGSGIVLLEPTDGLDPTDSEAYLQPLVGFLQRRRTSRLIYDLKNVPLVDNVYYQWLHALHRMCRITGIELVVANMAPAAAYALAQLLDGPPP
ncbi:MAG TPA: hypothetical protein VKA14_05120, partial [Gammaproteobacteria bacterium]|nr:hypothetical protein [Gammaproteobacteria bacterium]